MKLLCLFFSLMILAQSAMPCGDDAALLKPASVSYQAAYNSISSDHKDDCSPFCVCVCCSTPSVQQKESPISLVFFSFHPDYPSERSEKFIDVSLPVWQPPKLS